MSILVLEAMGRLTRRIQEVTHTVSANKIAHTTSNASHNRAKKIMRFGMQHKV